MKTGRNDPCPCGSGKKYKRCCISESHAVNDELAELMSTQDFDSMEEMQAAVSSLMTKQNQKAQDDFCGLSSEHVYQMLHYPYETPKLFQFPEQLAIEPVAPILMLMEGIVSAIDEKGLQATKAKGSLPQKLCREVWDDYNKLYVDTDDMCSFIHKVNKEDDFIELHVTRILLEVSGFLRKTKGRFYLTKKYQKIAGKSGLKGIYPILFKSYCDKFNWDYWDRYEDVPFIQQSFLFTLYLLKQYGDKMTSASVYEDDFLRAFPMVIDEIEGSMLSTPEEKLRACYNLRVFRRFLSFMGLAELEIIKSDKLYDRECKVRKTPLFDAVIHFNLVESVGDKAIYSSVNSDRLH